MSVIREGRTAIIGSSRPRPLDPLLRLRHNRYVPIRSDRRGRRIKEEMKIRRFAQIMDRCEGLPERLTPYYGPARPRLIKIERTHHEPIAIPAGEIRQGTLMSVIEVTLGGERSN